MQHDEQGCVAGCRPVKPRAGWVAGLPFPNNFVVATMLLSQPRLDLRRFPLAAFPFWRVHRHLPSPDFPQPGWQPYASSNLRDCRPRDELRLGQLARLVWRQQWFEESGVTLTNCAMEKCSRPKRPEGEGSPRSRKNPCDSAFTRRAACLALHSAGFTPPVWPFDSHVFDRAAQRVRG